MTTPGQFCSKLLQNWLIRPSLRESPHITEATGLKPSRGMATIRDKPGHIAASDSSRTSYKLLFARRGYRGEVWTTVHSIQVIENEGHIEMRAEQELLADKELGGWGLEHASSGQKTAKIITRAGTLEGEKRIIHSSRFA